ncbi:uncharacterized protein ISCGN_008600 [Ixodes scapularis]
MGLTEITLVLVSLAFVATAAAHDCQNGTRPASEEKREGCDYYCWNAETKSWDKFFFGNGERSRCLWKVKMRAVSNPPSSGCAESENWRQRKVRLTFVWMRLPPNGYM